MGIKGLLQFLKEQQKIDNLKTYRGCTAAVDVYCWLHRAVYGCVEQIAIAGNDQGQYVAYCEKYWNTLKSFGIKPILVFDGQNLPAKAHTEKERRDRRKANREKANALLAEGKRAEARQYFERCIDITPQMAHRVIVAAVSQGIDCIVAPYEADAQLAYLSISGIAQLIISEDSDLLCFGCERVMFKLDLNGNGIVQERSRLLEHKSFRKRLTFDHFVKMCILSGCDYVPSLPGIGLAKACKFITQNQSSSDNSSMLRRLPLSIKLPQGSVTDEYVEKFNHAFMTFKHQVVFDPLSRTRKPMTPHTDTCCDLTEHPKDMAFAGRYFPQQQSMQIALGNVNLHNMDPLLPKIDPDLLLTRENGRLSIWHPDYKPKGTWDGGTDNHIDRHSHSTNSKSALISADRIVRKRRLSQCKAEDLLSDLNSGDAGSFTSTPSDSVVGNETSCSTVKVCPKTSKESIEAETTSDGFDDIEALLKGPATPPKLTPREGVNRFKKDKLRGIYHSDEKEEEDGVAKVTVTSRYFGSSQKCGLDQQDMSLSPSDSGIASVNQSQLEDLSQSDASQFSPSNCSTQSNTTYKAKFLGALDQLDSHPLKSNAFRWSKSSIHESGTESSGLSPNPSQQFKSPLLKSKLAQLTSAAHSDEAGVSIPPINPFRRQPKVSPTMRSAVTANPFKLATSPSRRERAVFGKAVEVKSADDPSDPFTAKQLSRIGSKTEKPLVTRRLSAFKLTKSPTKEENSQCTDSADGDNSSQKENCATIEQAACQRPGTLDSGPREILTTNNMLPESSPPDSNTRSEEALKDVEMIHTNERSNCRAFDSPILSQKLKNSNKDSVKKKSGVSSFLAKFTRPKAAQMPSAKRSTLLVSQNSSEIVIDLT
ncbi:exonuclease 1-like [Watersipora subatra]|uniref:exonuclease 1-like n=1 Tax=Watersipora subatra TaxID=2589382 RepID=UPI00355B446C